MTDKHWPECWRYTSHHACAVAEVERLQAELDKLVTDWGAMLEEGHRLATLLEEGCYEQEMGQPDMTELHSTTAAVLQAIKTFWAEYGFSPSIRDIMAETGITSTSVVRYHIDRLERAGIIERTPGVARSYVLVERI